MKLVILIFLLSSIAGCGSIHEKQNSYVVQTNGVGETCELAVQNAKQAAVERVTGSLLHGQRQLVGTHYSESINEFSGGTVKDSRVLSASKGDVCRVEIVTEIEPGNLKITKQTPMLVFDLDQMREKKHKQEESKKRLAALINRPELIKVRFGDLQWKSDSYEGVQISYQLVELEPSDSWYSDLEDFFKVQGVVVLYTQEASHSSSKSILKSFWNQKNSTASYGDNQTNEICFKNGKPLEIRCYRSTVVNDALAILDSMYLIQTITDAERVSVASMPVRPLGLSLYVRQSFSERFVSQHGSATHVFNFIASPQLPISVSSRIKSESLKQGKALSIKIGFAK